MKNEICQACGLKLKESQRATIHRKNYKSCPNCSIENGDEHVYYLDELFGTSEKRGTINNPDGIQSYCTPCRGEEANISPQILCGQVKI
ncbi:MAG: hypothetical protein LR001_01235 [Clostridiales bacterium]|nr:hypothetical protein [Clostridiales bacterium]